MCNAKTWEDEIRQETTYAELLLRSLKAGGRGAEDINGGVSGFGISEEYVFLDKDVSFPPPHTDTQGGVEHLTGACGLGIA